MGILLTEISANNGCSLYAHEQHAGEGAKETGSGGVDGMPVITGSFRGGGRANMSTLMKELDEDRLASEQDVQKLQTKLDQLQGGVDKLAGVIGELMLISSKRAPSTPSA